MTKIGSNKGIPWWVWIAGFDLFLLFSTWLKGHSVEAPFVWRLTTLRLTSEMNLAAWWSGACLFAVALLCYEYFSVGGGRLRKPFLGLAFFFAFLSFDEIGSVHERLSALESGKGLASAAALLAVIPLYAAAAALRKRESRKTGILLGLGVVLIASVALQEQIEATTDWTRFPNWFVALRPVVEEGSELLATLVFFAAVIALRPDGRDRDFSALVADPRKTRLVEPLILFGLVLHLVVCLLVFPALDDIPRRGNPAVWYPAMLNLLLAGYAFWAARDGADHRRIAWSAASAGFLLSSATLMGNLLIFVPGTVLEPELAGRLLALYGWQTAFAVWLMHERGVPRVRIGIGLVCAAVLVALHLRFAVDLGLVLALYGVFLGGVFLIVHARSATRVGVEDERG